MADGPTSEIPAAATAADAAPAVGRPCLRCRYDLRGSPADAACPECGLPVRASLEGTPLLHAPSGWLRHMALASGVSAAAAFVLVLHAVCQTFGFLPRPSRDESEFPLRPALEVCVDLLLVVGAWMLTRPQPGEPESALSPRRRMRVAVFLVVLVEAGCFLSPATTFRGLTLMFTSMTVAELLLGFFRMLYLRRLAFQMALPGLAFQIGFAFAGAAACLVAGRLLAAMFFLVWELKGRPRGFPDPPRSAAAEYVWWGFTLYTGVVLLGFRRAFLRIAGPVERGAGAL